MDFNPKILKSSDQGLTLEYFLVPWDTEIFGVPVAAISAIEVHDPAVAENSWHQFENWYRDRSIEFCSCRIAHSRIQESFFLGARDFRFVELNYHPELKNLGSREIPASDLVIEPVAPSDREELAGIAEQIYSFGRLRQDPTVHDSWSDLRYRIWLENAFNRDDQQVFKGIAGDKTAAFFVVEFPEPGHSFWSLVGVAPGMQGQGIGKRAWNAMLSYQREHGIDSVSTSITSHNVAVMNLYVGMGFRFPEPLATFHRSDSARLRGPV